MNRKSIFLFLRRLFLTLCIAGILACTGMVFAKDSPPGGGSTSGSGNGGTHPKIVPNGKPCALSNEEEYDKFDKEAFGKLSEGTCVRLPGRLFGVLNKQLLDMSNNKDISEGVY